MHKSMTYEQAKKYIAGEEFNKSEYERKHLIMLKESAENALQTIDIKYRPNLKKTVARYLENHAKTEHIKEYNDLKAVYESI